MKHTLAPGRRVEGGPSKPVRVVRLIPATEAASAGARAEGAPAVGLSYKRSRAPIPVRYPEPRAGWVRPALWWVAGLVVLSAWDRAAWVWVSSGGKARWEWLEVTRPWSWVLKAPYLFGTLYPWLGVAVLLIALAWVKPDAGRVMAAVRRAVLLILSAAVGGALAEGLKLVVRRYRPEASDGAYMFRAWGDRTWSTSGLGMASSHAGVAFGAALALGAIWPRWRWEFLACAAACALSRVLVGAHYVSDVYVGASVGVVGFMLVCWGDLRVNRGVPLGPARA